MILRPYREKDFEELRAIATHYWAEEVEMDDELVSFTYDYLIRHYLHNNGITYVAEDSKIVGFALAYFKDESNNSIEFFKNHVKSLSNRNQKLAYEYLEYLNYNHDKVAKYLNDDDVYFGLLASIQKGAGSALIANLKKVSKEHGASKIMFWTDETCDYHYYERKGFELVETYEITLYNHRIKTFIYQIVL